jgi:hypothetical protein
MAGMSEMLRGKPPNLREAQAQRVSCRRCTHYAKSVCGLYSYHVRPGQLCDSFKAKR